MSATVIGKVAAVFTASTSGLTAGVNTARAEFTKLDKSVSGLKGSLNTLVGIQGAQLFAGLAAGAVGAARQIGAIAGATAEVIDQQSKLAAKIGVPLESFAALAQAADLAGISQEKVTVAVQKMGVELVKASNGTKSAQAAFAALGLSAEELSAMQPDQAFQKIAEEIGKLPTPAERTAAAMKIFGKAGKDLGPLFTDGGAAIRQAAEETRLFGVALDTVSGQNVETMNDSFTRLGKAFEGFKMQIVAAFAPAVTAEIERVIQSIKDAGGMRNVALDFAQTVGVAAIQLVDSAESFAKILKEALGEVGSVWQRIKGVGQLAAGTVEMVGAGLVGGAGMASVASIDLRDGGVSGAILDRAELMQSEAGRLLNQGAANIMGEADQNAYRGGTPQGAASSERMRIFMENLERMRQPAPAPPAQQAEAAARAAANDEKQTTTAELSLGVLKQIALALGVPPAATNVFVLPGTGGR